MSSLSIRRVILIACVILAAFSLALALLYSPPAKPSVPALHRQEAEVLYIVKAYHDQVAVFSGTDETPLQITGIRVSMLPLQDQLDLAEGISVHSETALSALLEDYGS